MSTTIKSENERKSCLENAEFDIEKCRFFRDRCYGIGQTVWTTLTSLTGIMLAGKCVIIAGYGVKGKDIAGTARAFGARVTVAESNAVRALEAVMDGFDVVTMDEAARYGDIFVTATDMAKVISEQAFMVMKNGAVLCNAEASCKAIDTEYLEETYIEKEIRENGVTEYELMNGRCLKIIAQDSITMPAEMTELDKEVYLLATNKLADSIADASAAEDEAISKAIKEAREEVARRKLRKLGCRI